MEASATKIYTAGKTVRRRILAALILQAENYINLQCLVDSHIF